MKKIPTKLKQLAERRARLIGELNASVMTEKYSDQIAILKLQLKNMEELFLASAAKKERLLKELAAIDIQFLDAYPTVNTGSIEPIVAWKGRYGKRGALNKFVLETLKSYAPAFVPTTKLAELAMIEFSLVFENSAARRHWYDNSFRGALRKMLMMNQPPIHLTKGFWSVDSTSKAFFWSALASMQPRQSAKYQSNSSIVGKSSKYSYHLCPCPNQIRFLIACQNSTGFSKKEQGCELASLFGNKKLETT